METENVLSLLLPFFTLIHRDIRIISISKKKEVMHDEKVECSCNGRTEYQ